MKAARALGGGLLAICLGCAALLMFMPPPTHVPLVIACLVLLSACAGALLCYGLQRWIRALASVAFATVFGAGALVARNAAVDAALVPLSVAARPQQCVLDISGDLTDDLYRRVQRELDVHRSIRAVLLDSAGGSALSVARVADLLRERGVGIAAMHDQCDSACAFLWIAARERYVVAGMSKNAVAGFHAPHLDIPWIGARRAMLQDQQQRAYLRHAGLPEDFIGWAYASVDEFWRPDAAQLSRLGIETRQVRARRAQDVDFCRAVPGTRKA
jgi:hypothetical protein